MPSTSKKWLTVVLPLPMPPVMPTFNITEELCCRCRYYIGTALLALSSGKLHRNSRALYGDKHAAGNLELQGAVLIDGADTAVDAGGRNDLFAAADALAEFLLLFRALSLWPDHKKV